MGRKKDILDTVRQALHSEPRIGTAAAGIRVAYEDGCVILEGEVPNIGAKKRALQRVARLPDVTGIADRLHVTPAQPMGDKEIRDLVCRALLQEPALSELEIWQAVGGQDDLLRSPPEHKGIICVSVDEGAVTLNGDAPTLAHKRLAGVLSWWVPGSRDVINGLGVIADETPLDGETTDAVHMALEKDPFVDASQIRIFTRSSVVTLDGLVPTDSEREMAEADAWYVFGVDRVENRIEVRPVEPHGAR